MNNEKSAQGGSALGRKLSVIIPAYNEGHRIGKTLLELNGYLSRQNFDYEIIVVVDGATDNTASVVSWMQGQIKNLQLIDNRQNYGKGWVVRQGMLSATGDLRLFMDADNSTSVDQVIKMLPFFEQGFDVVIGSRRIQGAVIAAHQPWIRDFLGSIFRLIVHTLVPLGLTDSQCGFKAFTAQAAERIFPRQSVYRWAFDVEILALAEKFGLKIKEVPVTWVNDAESHVKLSGMVRMLFEVLSIRWNLWTGKYK
jgi:glycosyltransferase involved in cell wall biosynthesis